MTQAIIHYSILFSLVCSLLSMMCCTLRLLIGPSAQDRILAIDTLWTCSLVFILTLGLHFANSLYFDIAMVVALTGFISTVALAKFLMRGEVIE